MNPRLRNKQRKFIKSLEWIQVLRPEGSTQEDFFVSKYNITNKQFHRFLTLYPKYNRDPNNKEMKDMHMHDGDYLNHWSDDKPKEGRSKYPVVYVSQPIAQIFCEKVEGRLPTQEE